MPKKKTKRRTKIAPRISHAIEIGLEEGTSNHGASSAKECSTVFKEHGKTVELSCEVELPKHQELAMSPLFASEPLSQADMDIKRELLDDIIGYSGGQLLDSVTCNIIKNNAVTTLENCTPNEIKTENTPEIIVIDDDSDEFTAMDSEQERNDFLEPGNSNLHELSLLSDPGVNNIKSIHSCPISSNFQKVESVNDIEKSVLQADQERNRISPVAVNASSSEQVYLSNAERPITDINITLNSMQMSAGENPGAVNIEEMSDSNASTIPSTCPENSAIPALNLNMTLNENNNSKASMEMKEEPIDTDVSCFMANDIMCNNAASVNDIEKSVLQADQERNRISPGAVNASSSEQVYLSNAERPITDINITLNSMQMSASENPGAVNIEEMSDSNASTIPSTCPENSAIPALNLNMTLNENNNSKASMEMKEEPIDTEVSSFMANDIMCNNAASVNDIEKSVLQADQERNRISPGAVNASSSEQVYLSNAERPIIDINITLNSMQMSASENPGAVNIEEMSDSNASTIPSTCPENSAIPALNLNRTLNENNNSKASMEMKEEPIDTEVSSFMANDIMCNNTACSNEIIKTEENMTLAYLDVFSSSWGLADETGVEKFNLCDLFFSELGMYLRALGHEQKKTEAAKTFSEKAVKEHTFNKEISNADRNLLKRLFPTEVPDASEINEVNEIERHNAHVRRPPTSDPANVTEVRYEIANTTENDNSSEITLMDSHDANIGLYPEVEKVAHSSQSTNNYFDPQVSKADINIERTLEVLKLDFQKIVKTFPIQALQDIINNVSHNSNENVEIPTYEVEPPSMSNQSVIENNSSHSQLVPTRIVCDDEPENNCLPNSAGLETLHSEEHDLHDNSADSSVDNSRFDNSSDDDITAKSISFEEALSPELSSKRKKKISNQHAEFIPRKKSRYEIIMERREREKLLHVGNYRVKGKNMTSCNKTSQLSASSKYKGLEFFHPTPATSTSSQKRKITNCNDTVKEKAKVIVTEITKMDTCKKKKKDGKLPPSQSVRDTGKSGLFGFNDMNAGTRFKNRNSSLFEDLTKVAQQPTPYRARPGRQKNPSSNSSQLNMEEVHAQIDTDSITVSEPQKKRLSLREYQLRNKILSSLNNEFLNTDTRSFSPNSQSCFESHPSLDPQLTRRQNEDFTPNLNCVRGYQLNPMTESTLPSNNLLPTLSSSNWLPNTNHNPWNMPLPMENRVLSTMTTVSNPTNFQLVHSNRNSPVSSSLVLSPSRTLSSDDMELCDFEPSTILHSASLDQVSSSYRTQNFGSTASAASYVHGPRLQPTSSYGISSCMSATIPSESVNLPCLTNEDDPREVNLIPLRLLDSVGQTVMTSDDALAIVLSWVPNWLKEVDRPDQRNPPPLFGNMAVLKATRLRYTDMPNHFTTIFPLMLFDLFFRMHDMMRTKVSGKTTVYVFNIVKSTRVNDVMEIEAKTFLSEKPLFSIGGQLAVMTYGLTCGKQRDVFAFIENQHIYLDPTTKEEVLHIKIIHGVRNLNTHEKIYVFPFYSFSKFMSQVDALGYIKNSPLRDIILNPYQPACTKINLERVGGPALSLQVINRAVEKIKNGISLNEPEEPRILIINSPPGTDLMTTLIATIEDVKKLETSYQKHRILICTRTLKQLENIGLRLFSIRRGESERPVIAITILLKVKGIPNEMLKKLSLEHQVFQLMKSVKKTNTIFQEQLSEGPELQEVKKDIFRNSDVILSRIPQSYDNDLQTFFGIGKDFQFSFCIIDEAYIFTEPEASLPLLYDIKKLILAGETQEKRKGVVSRLSDHYGYYQPLPLRLSLALEE